MSGLRDSVEKISAEVSKGLSALDYETWNQLPTLITSSKRIFALGNGRSGFAVSAAAMRLMHFGLNVHVVGEVTNPAIAEGDLLIAVSGSGSTNAVVYAAEQAINAGASVAAITTNAESKLAAMSTHVFLIPAAEKTDRTGATSAQYAGSLFEQLVFLTFDCVFDTLWKRSGIPADELYKNHSNLG